jgi:hypothetical protein
MGVKVGWGVVWVGVRFGVGMEVGIRDGIRAREERRHKGGRVSIRGHTRIRDLEMGYVRGHRG